MNIKSKEKQLKRGCDLSKIKTRPMIGLTALKSLKNAHIYTKYTKQKPQKPYFIRLLRLS